MCERAPKQSPDPTNYTAPGLRLPDSKTPGYTTKYWEFMFYPYTKKNTASDWTRQNSPFS